MTVYARGGDLLWRIPKDLTRLSVCMEDGKARDHE